MARQFKIFRLWRAAYQQTVRQPYLADPTLASAPYDEQMKRFFASRSTFSDYFSRTMGALGHEVMEVVYDLEPAQKAWAREHGVTWGDWERDIPLAQIGAFKPDVVYLHSLVSIPEAIGAEAKARYPFIKLVAAYAGSKVYPRQLPGVDLMIVGVLPMVEEFRALGIETHPVYHGFDRTVLEALEGHRPVETVRHPFTFVGTSGFGYCDSFTKRYWLLAELQMRLGLEAWVNDSEDLMPATHAMDWSILDGMRGHLVRQVRADRSVARLKVYLAKLVTSLPMAPEVMEEYRTFVVPGDHDPLAELPVVPFTRIMPEQCRPPVYGLDFYDLLRRSDVTLNVEADINQGVTANMRMFEATGVGTCLLTESTPNLAALFEPDREVVAYGSVEECIEKAEYLIGHPEARRAIAAAAQRRTLKDHTIEQRCQEIDALLQRFVG